MEKTPSKRLVFSEVKRASYAYCLSQFRKVEKLPAEKKKLVKEFLDAFIFKADL